MENIETLQNKRERVQYIDALRGFAMLMVVLGHVEIFSFFNFTHTTTLMSMLSAIHMPLFFFISGLCVYNPEKKYAFIKVKNDFLRLIVPAVIVGLIYTYFKKGENCSFFLANSMKAGYWFTISLFEVLLIYYAISNLLRKSDKVFMLVLWTVAGLLYLLKLPFKMDGSLETIGNYLCLHQTFNFFVFFALGITVSKYRLRIHSLLENQLFAATSLILFATASFVLLGIVPKYANSSIVWRVLDTFGETIVGLLGITLLYIIFYKRQSVFSSSNRLIKNLVFIGNNTLAIYLVHYFFLPVLPQVGTFMLENCSVILELSLGLIGTCVVVFMSLSVSKLLTIISPFIGYILLGNKQY